MQDENGLFIGNNWCKHWIGVREIVQKECCGGRKTPMALIDCEERGVLEAETGCNASCKFKKIKQV